MSLLPIDFVTLDDEVTCLGFFGEKYEPINL